MNLDRVFSFFVISLLALPIVSILFKEVEADHSTLLVRYNFEHDFLDSSSHKADGSAINSPTFVHSFLTGEIENYAVRLNGNDQYVLVGGNIADFGERRNFTLSAWIRTSSSDVQYIFFKGDFTTKFYSLRVDSVGKVSAEISDGANNAIATSDLSVNNGNWQHVSATFNREGNLQVFVNGTATGNIVPMSQINDISNDEDLLVGVRNNDELKQFYFSGELDDIRIYDVAFVQVPIILTARSGSHLYEPNGSFIVSDDYCIGKLVHDSSLSTQYFLCSPSSTIRITAAPDTDARRYRFSDGIELQEFESCHEGTCKAVSFDNITRQFAVNVKVIGINSTQHIGIHRTQIGSLGIDYIKGGGTYAKIWVDQGRELFSSLIVKATDGYYDVISDTNQGLYSNFITRIGENITQDSALAGKTINSVIFRLDKVGLPHGILYVTIRDQDDNIVHELGSLDTSSLSVAASDYRFRFSPYTLQSSDKILIEYYGGNSTNRVRVWFSSADQFDARHTYLVHYTESNYFSFEHNDIGAMIDYVLDEQFIASSPRSFVVFESSNKTISFQRNDPSSSLILDVDTPEYKIKPGESLRGEIKMKLSGFSNITIPEIIFDSNPNWFSLEKPLPIKTNSSPEDTLDVTIPITISVPLGISDGKRNVNVTITALSDDGNYINTTSIVTIIIDSNQSLIYYVGIGVAVAIASIGIIYFKYSRHKLV